MTDKQIFDLIQFELKNKRWGFTEQILEIHKPVFINNILKIENIVRIGNSVTVYLPVENEKFYLTFFIDSIENEISGISTEPHISVYFKAVSDNLSETELRNMTKLEIKESWNKGDKRISGKRIYNFSCILIDINSKPNNFEQKLSELITLLQKDKEGIKNLCKIANGYIQAVIEYHNGNGMISGPVLSSKNIKNVSDLNLMIEFDFFVSGNSHK